MANITSVGIGSGLDLESLVKNIINAERAPTESRLNLQEARAQATISAYGNLKNTLAAFQSSLSDLKESSFYSNRTAISANTSAFTATSESTSQEASYQVAVLALATDSKVATNAGFASPESTVGEGTLDIGLIGSDSFSISVAATDTLDTIRDAINNSTSNVGVSASLLTVDAGMGDGSTITELVITSNTTGADNQITISVDDTGDADDTNNLGLSRFHFDGSDPEAVGNQMLNKIEAQDAKITVDGFTAFSSTNVFSDVISGISITAIQAEDDPETPTPAALNIAIDTSGVEQKITTFAATYNELITVLNTLTDYNAVTETRGILGNDSSARIIEAQLRRVVTDRVAGAPSDFDGLGYLGFKTNQNGTIELDSSKLKEVVPAQFDNLSNVFTGENGVASRLDSLLTSMLQANGTIATKENILNSEIKTIEEERLALVYRVEKIEERYRLQFSALDILVSQLNSTGDFLTQQLEATSKIISGK